MTTSQPAAALANYQALLAKVDAKVMLTMAQHPKQFACTKGCHSCCLPGLTVNAVEAEALASYVASSPQLAAAVTQLVADHPHAGQRCALLTAEGSCAVYPARPIVCRSHGLPLTVATPAGEELDVCPLNFVGQDLAALPPGDFINLETLNTLLSLIARQFTGETGGTPARVPLAMAALAQVKVP